MRFGSVCSGIEAASVAWGPLGWQGAWFSEIEPFPSNLLAHHYPNVPNHGDMTTLHYRIRSGEVEAPDMLCGGTPCQAFSVAGLRKSLDDARGNLSLVFCEIANAIDDVRFIDGDEPAVVFWENVPGVLNTKDNAFGCFLAGLAGEDDPLVAPGGKWTNAGYVLGPKRAVAWRVTDAQYFGVAQRRRRVFVVSSAREGFDPAAVLFEFEGVRRDTAPIREAGEVAPTIPARSSGGGGLGTDFDCDGGVLRTKQWPADVSCTLDTTFGTKQGLEDQHVNAGCPMFVPFDTTQITSPHNYSAPKVGDPCHPLSAVAYSVRLANTSSNGWGIQEEVTHTLDCTAGPAVQSAMQVRRLTPTECERLQGFPDGYTLVPVRGKPAADGPRYKALGNSWAVPNVRWIGQRIDLHLLGLL